ncbi:hypothetical protein HWV62_28268 [Athelia sp. TMB]|nr:hypothetical protein HWV62_28268 [Athelia sp. TMB]
MAVATSIHQFDQTIHLLHPIFSSLDADVALPRNTARSPQAQLVVDRLQFYREYCRELKLSLSSTVELSYLVKTTGILASSSLEHLSICNIDRKGKHKFHLCVRPQVFSHSLKSLQFFEIEDLSLPTMVGLEALTLSGYKNRIPLESVALFLRKLPHLRTLKIEGTPIAFEPGYSIDLLSTLLLNTPLPYLKYLSITGLRSRREHTSSYLTRLLALLSPATSIISLSVQTGNELQDLNFALRSPWPSPRFPNLLAATFQIINPPECSLRCFLNMFSSISHATLLLEPSHKNYRLTFEPANFGTSTLPLYNLPRIETVEIQFTTEREVQKFLDVAAARSKGLRTVWASAATIYGLRASGLFIMTEVKAESEMKEEEEVQALVMKDRPCSSAKKMATSCWHLACEGKENFELCVTKIPSKSK